MNRGTAWAGSRLLLPALALLLWVHRESYASVVATWQANSTFTHGFLIVPLCLWLAWRNRGALAAVEAAPSWLGAVALLACGALWVVGRGVGVIGVEQCAAIAMIPALVLATCGPAVVRVMAMPLGYLVFAMPAGYALVPLLMQSTAEVATWALQVSLVPVHRTDMYISIPGGQFEVARACSGLNYVVTGLALGALYTYLTYAGWRKRLLSMLAFIVIPVVANGLRVYFTILTAHLTNMRFGPGAEHVWFGRAFFILVMLAMFWVGRRWADDVPPPPVRAPMHAPRDPSPAGWAVVAASVLVVVGSRGYLRTASAEVERQLVHESTHLAFPPAGTGWTGPAHAPDQWKPLFYGARVERDGRYSGPQGSYVDAYVGVYGLGVSGGAEMISYGNRIFAEEHRSLGRDELRTVTLAGGRSISVRSLRVDDGSGRHLVWYWFVVGDRVFTSPYAVKLQEALSFIVRRAVTERIVTLATPVGADDDATLVAFVAAHSACAGAGFAAEVCAQ